MMTNISITGADIYDKCENSAGVSNDSSNTVIGEYLCGISV